MNLDINIFKIETNHILPTKGRILVAEPFLPGSYFNRAVVLLVAHSEKGAVGFILNKKIDYSLREIVPDFPEFDVDIYVGGPVSTDTIYFIHSLGDALPGSIQVKENIYWGGDFNELKRLISLGMVEPDQVRFFLGYSGWDGGQLEEELAENTWLVTEIEPQSVMDCSIKKHLWLQVVKELGGKYSLWENYPENPSMN